MEPVKEGPFAKLAVLVAVIGVAITWYYAHDHAEVIEAPSRAATSSSHVETFAPPALNSPSGQSAEPAEPRPRQSSKEARPSHQGPLLPLDLTLFDGEQRTFLDDQASVGVEFNEVGSEDFVTLRVSTTDDGSVPHAILGAGARYSFHMAGIDYWVYVTSVDKTARTIGVRINRQKKGE